MEITISNKELLTKLNQLSMAYLPALDLDSEIELLSQAYYGFTQSLLHFGEAELNYRTGERFNVLKLSPDVVKYSNDQLKVWNDRGIGMLDEVIKAVNEFIKSGVPGNKGVKVTEFDDYRLRLKEYLAQTHLKVSDVVKLTNAFDQVVERATKGGELGVISFMRDKLVELKEVRLSPSRGTEENIPIWKLIGAIILFGFPVYKALRCLIRGRCCRTVSGLEGLVAFIAAVAVTLC